MLARLNRPEPGVDESATTGRHTQGQWKRERASEREREREIGCVRCVWRHAVDKNRTEREQRRPRAPTAGQAGARAPVEAATDAQIFTSTGDCPASRSARQLLQLLAGYWDRVLSPLSTEVQPTRPTSSRAARQLLELLAGDVRDALPLAGCQRRQLLVFVGGEGDLGFNVFWGGWGWGWG